MAISITDIERAALDYSRHARELRNIREGLDDAIVKVNETFMADIAAAAKKAAESRKLLELLVAESPALFEKPKTLTIGDVKVGFVKQKGRLEIPDPNRTIAKIRERYPDLAATAIKISLTPVKETLAKQPADVLRKLGVMVTADANAPVVKLVDTGAQKMIETIFAEQSKAAE